MICFLTLAAFCEKGVDTLLASEEIRDPQLRSLWSLAKASGTTTHPLELPRFPMLATFPQLAMLRTRLGPLSSLPADYVVLTQTLSPISRWTENTKIVAYVHFPPYDALETTSSSLIRKAYLAPAKLYAESILKRIDTLICNSKFTLEAAKAAWADYQIPEPAIVYPASLREFDSSARWEGRRDRCVYVARLSSFKRHELMKACAARLTKIEFCSVGSYTPSYDRYMQDLVHRKPPNYQVVPNGSPEFLRAMLEQSKLYVHCAKDEHFGISILEAMNAGCVPLVHASGGPREILPERFWWGSLDELVEKCEELTSDKSKWSSRQRESIALASKFGPAKFKHEFAEAVMGT